MATFTVTTTANQTSRLSAVMLKNTGLVYTVPMIEKLLFNYLKKIVIEGEAQAYDTQRPEPEPFEPT